MRLDALLCRLPYSLLISSLTLAVAAPAVESVELTVLTPANFKDSVSKGVWFVEHFSPYCGHCRRFAPTWTQLVEETEKKEDPGIRLAQVNCAVDGDLCRENKVDGYPQLNLYKDGEFVEVFKQSRELDILRDYISKHARPTGKPAASSDQALLAHEAYNPDGVVVALDEASFDKAIQKGHVFVKFFAPWCGHCKKLAPIWRELAKHMRGKLNIVEVDCEAHGSICRKEGISGYPMLFYYGDNGSGKTEYTGGRKFDQLRAFSEKVSGPAVQELLPENLDKVVTANPVVYLLLHPTADTLSLPQTIEASHALFGSPSVYVSTSPSLYNHFNVDSTKSVILALKDHNLATPAAWYTLGHSTGSTEALAKWLVWNRLPTYQELDSDTFQEVMNAKHKPLVVIAATPKAQLSEVSVHVKDIAKQWKDSKRAGDVVFTWMDADKWTSWLKSMYGVSAAAGAQVVIADHQRLVYWDVDQFGEKIQLTPASVFSAVQGAQSGTISYKNSENIAERIARMLNNQLVSIEGMVSRHPWRVTFFIVAALAALGLFLRRMLKDESALADELAHKARLD